uniref:Nectin cell adhesion molecule 3 n=1 Tax=Geotrypetes seraphini TaxID=260995 RepID=A0A6P8SJR9_GEOSA|nr:nectin-2-like isoform X3 [Geotrypetes seraphini]
MILVLEKVIEVLLLLFACCRAVHGQRVKVRDEATGYIGQEVVLQCIFNPGTNSSINISQVTWVKSVTGKKISIAVFHPVYGESYPWEGKKGRFSFQAPSLKDASLVIRPLKMGDEGTYICEFATYPNGNEEAETKLVLLAEPRNSAQAILVTANDTETTVATCISADGRPPPQITWQSNLSGNFSTSQINNTDGTVTVTSQYNIVPSSQANGQSVICVITHKTSKEPYRIPITLSIQYPPEVTIEGYDDNWYISRTQADLKCIAKGNPPPTNFHWSSTNGPLPRTVEVINNLLVVKIVDNLVNTTFICQVTNAVGTSSSQLNILVRGSPDNSGATATGGIVGGIIASIVVITAVITVVLICKQQQKNQTSCDDLEGPPAYRPPPPELKLQSTEEDKTLDTGTEVLLKPDLFEPSSVVENSNGEHLKYREVLITEDCMDFRCMPNPNMDDDYLEQINPIYNELSYPASVSCQEDKGFVMSRAMYV